VVSAGNATLEDLGSKNGTFLGDQRISGTTSLSDGVTIRVGSVPFVVRVYRRPETTVTST
jgi:pSer/pThr/pTyr-binding forkhead associated (FHA) protein